MARRVAVNLPRMRFSVCTGVHADQVKRVLADIDPNGAHSGFGGLTGHNLCSF